MYGSLWSDTPVSSAVMPQTSKSGIAIVLVPLSLAPAFGHRNQCYSPETSSVELHSLHSSEVPYATMCKDSEALDHTLLNPEEHIRAPRSDH